MSDVAAPRCLLEARFAHLSPFYIYVVLHRCCHGRAVYTEMTDVGAQSLAAAIKKNTNMALVSLDLRKSGRAGGLHELCAGDVVVWRGGARAARPALAVLPASCVPPVR